MASAWVGLRPGFKGSERPPGKGVLPGAAICTGHLAHANKGDKGLGLRGDLSTVVPDPLASPFNESEERWTDTTRHQGQVVFREGCEASSLGGSCGCVAKFHGHFVVWERWRALGVDSSHPLLVPAPAGRFQNHKKAELDSQLRMRRLPGRTEVRRCVLFEDLCATATASRGARAI